METICDLIDGIFYLIQNQPNELDEIQKVIGVLVIEVNNLPWQNYQFDNEHRRKINNIINRMVNLNFREEQLNNVRQLLVNYQPIIINNDI